jgi:hypothetical protein
VPIAIPGRITATDILPSCGKYSPIESFRRRRPSSTSISAPTAVSGLVIEAMGKMVKFYARLMQVWGTKEMSIMKERSNIS